MARRKISVDAPQIDFSKYTSIADFAEDCLYLFEKNQKVKLKLTPYQRRWLAEVENPENKVVVICVPKRAGKSLFSAIVALFYALTKMMCRVIVLSTSEKQASSVSFSYIRQFCRTSELILPEVSYFARNRVEFVNGSVIEAVPCTVEAVAGRPADLLIIDELALIDDEETVQVAMSQTEKPDAKTLITSTASTAGHLLYRLYLASQEKSIAGLKFIYQGEEIYNEHPFITKEWLEQRRKQMPEVIYRQYHKNEFGVEGDRVFKEENVNAAMKEYELPLPPEKVEEIIGKKVVGMVFAAGIDRALPFSKHGDRSVGCVVANCLLENNENVYVVCDLKIFEAGTAEEIKKWLLEISRIYPLASICFEVYQAYDLYAWASNMGLNTKLEHATTQSQFNAFASLITAFEHQRIIIPKHDLLREELLNIERKNNKFGAPEGKHDDTVFALLWAFREAMLNMPSHYDIIIV